MKITLTPELKCVLELRHSQVRDVHECDRIKAVLLSSEGWSISQIAHALRKHEATISRYLLDFQKSQQLAPENEGSQSHLSEQHREELIEHLSKTTYVHTHQIVAYIMLTYSVQRLKWAH
jgi:transposase